MEVENKIVDILLNKKTHYRHQFSLYSNLIGYIDFFLMTLTSTAAPAAQGPSIHPIFISFVIRTVSPILLYLWHQRSHQDCQCLCREAAATLIVVIAVALSCQVVVTETRVPFHVAPFLHFNCPIISRALNER